jgi:hypothetical protein
MARLTPEERAELEAKLAEDDADDDDFEVDYAEGDRRARFPHSRRHQVARDYGFKGIVSDEPKADPKGKAAKAKGDDELEQRRFAGRRLG